MRKKKETNDVAVEIPADYNGEVTITRSHVVSEVKIDPLTNDFNHADLNVLRDKINEVISIIKCK